MPERRAKFQRIVVLLRRATRAAEPQDADNDPLPLAGEGRVRVGSAEYDIQKDGNYQRKALTPTLSRKRERELS
jgi:hypothetical protein